MQNLREDALDTNIEKGLSDLEKEIEGKLNALEAGYKKEVDKILADLDAAISTSPVSAEVVPEPEEAEEPEAEAEPEPETGTQPTPNQSTAYTGVPPSSSSPKWRPTWHGPILNPEPNMTPDDYYAKYGKNKPSWRKTLRHQGLTGLAKRIWRGTNPMQDIAWRYANQESARGRPTIQEYMEFKKIADFYISQYFPVNEATNPTVEKALQDAKKALGDALTKFILQVHSIGKGLKPAIVQLLKTPAGPSSVDKLGTAVESPPVETSKRRKRTETPEETKVKLSKEEQKLKTIETVESIKKQLVEEMLPDINDKLKEKGLDLTKWFEWKFGFNKKYDTEAKIKELRLELHSHAFKKLTNSSDNLIELAAFLEIQGKDYTDASSYIKNTLTKKRFDDEKSNNILDKIAKVGSMSIEKAKEKIVEKVAKLRQVITKPIDFTEAKAPTPEAKESTPTPTPTSTPEIKEPAAPETKTTPEASKEPAPEIHGAEASKEPASAFGRRVKRNLERDLDDL